MRRAHKAAHRRIWLVLVVLLPMIVAGALISRPVGPLEAPQIRLAPP